MLFAPQKLKNRSVHSGRLERWLGKAKVNELSDLMRHGGGRDVPWYGKPIYLNDVPGDVSVCGDGDFVGTFDHGHFTGALDSMASHLRRLWKQSARPIFDSDLALGVGFTGIPDLIARELDGYSQKLNFQKSIAGASGMFGDMWLTGAVPAAGAAGSASPGGRVPTSATTGAFPFQNPASGTLHLVGGSVSALTNIGSIIIYDRIFDVAKTMSGVAESVTGVPTRYQSTSGLGDDSAVGNFLFIAVTTTLNATAHNWTVCTYTDQSGNTGQTLPSVAGAASRGAGSLDIPNGSWFCPLASGDNGISALSQIQHDAGALTGGVTFVIAHPIAIMSFPVTAWMQPMEWFRSKQLVPRVFDNACLAMLQSPSGGGSFSGHLSLVNAP